MADHPAIVEVDNPTFQKVTWKKGRTESCWINHAKASSLSNSMICFLQVVLPYLVLSPMAFILGVPAASIRVIQRCLAARLSIRFAII